MSEIYERTEINATTKEAAKLTDTMKDTLAKLADQGWAFIGASTVKALLRRGLITANTAPRDPSQGVWCHYMLTDAGREAVEAEPQETTCGNRWKYGRDGFDNEGTPCAR